MYTLTTPLLSVKGIGPVLANILHKRDLDVVQDLLLFFPLHYEDRSLKKTINQLLVDELVTVEAEVTSASNFYKGPRSIQSATVKDSTGRLKLMWFNNPYIVARLVKGKKILVSGKLNDRGTMLQPTVEDLTSEAIHTGRLVPVYSSITGIAPTTLRKLLKHILDNLEPVTDTLTEFLQTADLPLTQALPQLHFPDTAEKIISARERFALEELLALIQRSHQLKKQWQELGAGVAIPPLATLPQLPFTLTTAQKRCIDEVTDDLQQTIPMNRLLIGDVGSGKTAVAGIACQQVLAAKQHAVLIAPTQILAEQHAQTFAKLFPLLPVTLVTSKTSAKVKADFSSQTLPTVFIGTHALFPLLEQIQPAFLIYDEQHRFGVKQRSIAQDLRLRPHVLTLSATPIPRTLMLTIFAHLNLSVIDEMPPGRQTVQTWLVPEYKRAASYAWLATHLQNQQALVICPFIDPSQSTALENVAAATAMHEQVRSQFPQYQVSLLHGRMSKREQAKVTEALFARQIQILVTTPIVEVGVDLPAAAFMVIEAAERFGLASLHQLRGRVGRAGQAAYCLLFTNASDTATRQRLQSFCQIHDGMKLAEMDLQRRGAGDIFGTQQHGFDDLQFANWTNLQLISRAKQIADTLLTQGKEINWQSFLRPHNDTAEIPLAN